MALAKYVALEIAVGCEELKINNLDYFKLQKLVYLCQCVHFKRFGVPLFPEKIYKSSSGAYLKELFYFFNKYEDSFIFKNDTLDKLKQWCNNVTNTLIFERETIIFVLDHYGNKSVDELISLTKKDPLFRTLKNEDIVEIDKLCYHFMTDKQADNIHKENHFYKYNSINQLNQKDTGNDRSIILNLPNMKRNVKILKIALELAIRCKENGITDLEYFKLQKLAYICQCVHFKRFHVPLFSETIYNDCYGPSFKKLFYFFNEYEDSFMFEERTFETLKNCCKNKSKLMFFEEETVNFVVDNYGDKSADELINLTKKDPLFDEIKNGDIINLSRLSEYFISDKQTKEYFSPYHNLTKTKKNRDVKLLKKHLNEEKNYEF